MVEVRLLVGARKGRFPGSNCLLVKGSRANVLVDAGCLREQILAARDKLDAVVYTHVHPDHIVHHSLLSGLKVWAPRVDLAFTSLRLLAYRYAPVIVDDWLDYAWRVFRLRRPPSGSPYDPWEEIRIGDVSLVMVPAYGHTGGHHLVWIDGHLHLSDIDLTGFGPWYAHPESSLEVFLSDIIGAAKLGARRYTSSHKEIVYKGRDGVEELVRYALRLCDQARRVTQSSTSPIRALALAGKSVIYRKYLPGMEAVMKYFEAMLVQKILDALVQHGDAVKGPEGYHLRDDAPERFCTYIRNRVEGLHAEG